MIWAQLGVVGAIVAWALAWIVASAIRNAHVCTCNEQECGGACEPRAKGDPIIFDYAATDDKI